MKLHFCMTLSTLAVCTVVLCEDAFVVRQRRGRDLHKEQQVDRPGQSADECVDVSYWADVTYQPATELCCDTVMEKHCHTKKKKVCGWVTDMECDIFPYTECDFVMKTEHFASDKMVESHYDVWECDQGRKNVTHLKKLPDCKNVTRMNCVQLWETVNGRKVKKNIDCEPVTWEECKLVNMEKNFEVPHVTCHKNGKIPYNQCQRDVSRPFMTTSLECKVKQKVTCQPKKTEKCAYINYRECSDTPRRECKPKRVTKPNQEFVHQEVCLIGGKSDSSGRDDTPKTDIGPNLREGGFHSFSSTNSFKHPGRGSGNNQSNRGGYVPPAAAVTSRPHGGYSPYAEHDSG